MHQRRPRPNIEPPPFPKGEPGTLQNKTDIEITEEYRKVEALIAADEPLIFVTGKAGTGKSTLIQYLRDTVRADCVVLAPTGVAAMNIQGATIHSFFRFPPRMLTDADATEVAFKKPYKKLRLLILDEISMVRADVLDAVDRFLRLNGPDRDRPFGGVQLLMIGDLHQLPPVVSNQDERQRFDTEYETPFFFSSRALAGIEIAALELTKVFRQQDPHFIELLNQVRLGAPTSDALGQINTRVTPHADANRETVLATTNLIADRINKRHLASLPTVRRSYHGETLGLFPTVNERLPSPMELMLKKDTRVMFTKNDSQARWVNGSLGTVMKMHDHTVMVELDETGKKVEVTEATWSTYKYEYDEDEQRNVPVVSGSFTQLPLTFAWAITIHKSQGKTLSATRIDLGRSAFAPGQVYVALSRCRRLKDLSLSRQISPHDVFCDQRVKAFYESLFAAAR
ncbi:MAG: DEAD/DEAH box helicase [Candidatus Krumholzibacteria bacterium]